MTLSSIFGDVNLILCRKVNMYDVEITRVKGRDKFENLRNSISAWGIKEGIENAAFVNVKAVNNKLKVSYIELFDMDGKKYYLFKSLSDLEYVLERCKNYTNADEGVAKISIFNTWKKLRTQTEKDRYFKIHSGIDYEYIKNILISLMDLDINVWKVCDFYHFSTDFDYNKKTLQLTDNRNYSEQCILSNDIRNNKFPMKPYEEIDKLKEQYTIWNRIENQWTYYSEARKLLTTEEYEKIKIVYDGLFKQACALIHQNKTTNDEEQMKQAGKKGEEDVEYALKWLPEDFVVIEKRDGIILHCDEIADEKQEFDHIVVSPQGVFSIETKNYSGKIVIDKQGNWIRHKLDGSIVGEENPTAQLMRHHRVLEAIVGKVEIHDLLCIANSKTIIEGAENSPVPVVKHDMLSYYLWNYRNENNKTYSKEEIRTFVERIESHRINR